MGCALCVRGCALIVSSVSFHGNIKIIIEQVKKLHYCAMSDVSPVYCARCSGPTCPVRKIRNPYAATYDPVWITVDPKPEHAELTGKVQRFICFEVLPCAPYNDPSPYEDIGWVYTGQYPWDMPISNVRRIMYQAAPEATIHDVIQHTKAATGRYDGSVWALVSHAHYVVACLHKRVLVEERGAWFATTVEEVATLNDYMSAIGPTLRAQHQQACVHLPYDTVSCEIARTLPRLQSLPRFV